MDSSSTAGGSTESLAAKSQLRRGVRVVGKVRPFFESEIGGSSTSQLSITRSHGDHALLSFHDQNTCRKDSYKLDWCYNQDENVDQVFSAEVKPLLEGLFRGRNACVIAYGARGSGKSQLIQGFEEIPGLAMIALGEILAFCNEIQGSVSVSWYEVSQDHIYDLLEPKEQEVLVLEDATRRIQLKGLSQVPVKSFSDFKRLYYHGCNPGKTCQKLPDGTTMRSHRGLIVYLFDESHNSFVGKINFVSLADYEDTKQKSDVIPQLAESSKQKGNVKPQVAESSKINKSLYTLLNIVYALNTGENFIPYRESKLTRLLQDFLCRTSMAVLITCLNPFPCQDTLNTINLASRSCQVANQQRHHSAKAIKCGSRFIQSCSPSTVGVSTLSVSLKKNEYSKYTSTEKKGYGIPSVTKRRPEKLGNSIKTLGTRLFGTAEKKENYFTFATKERKFSSGASPPNKKENQKDDSRLIIAAAVDTCCQDNDALDFVEVDLSLLEEENRSREFDSLNYVEHIMTKEGLKDDCLANEHTIIQETSAGHGCDDKLIADAIDINNDEIQSSPPLSERLREISNSLKLLSTQTNIIETPKTGMSPIKHINKEQIDPKTPGVPFPLRLENESKLEYIGTPQDIFKTRSTGLKKSLVQECLAFLNSANKEELKGLKGIGEKRATYILQLREESIEPFKDMDDLKQLGISTKQINVMMSQVLGDF